MIHTFHHGQVCLRPRTPTPTPCFRAPHCGCSILLRLSTKDHLLHHHHGCSRHSVTALKMASWHCIRAQAAMAPTLLLWPLPMCLNFPVILPSSYLSFILLFWVPVFTSFFFHIPVSTLLHGQEEACSLLYICSLALPCFRLTFYPLPLHTKPVFVRYLIPSNPSDETPTVPTE